MANTHTAPIDTSAVAPVLSATGTELPVQRAASAATPLDYRRLFESVPGIYLVLAPDLTIVAATNAQLLATMTNRNEVLGRPVFDVFPDNPDDPAANGVANVSESFARVLREGVTDSMGVQKFDIRKPLAAGGQFEERYWSLVNSPVFDDHGRVVNIILRAEDVTEFIRLTQREQQQRALSQELRQRAESMEAEVYLRAKELQIANERLCQANEEIRDNQRLLEQRVEERTAELAAVNNDLVQKQQENETFVYSVSHDLRSPLVNLQGFSQELSTACQALRSIMSEGDCSPDERQRGLALIDQDMSESIRFVQSAVARLSGIIDALLRLSRLGRIEVQLQAVDAHEVAARVVDSLASTITDRKARVELGNLPMVLADPTPLGQILANLVGNALAYLDPQRPGLLELGVANPPAGIPETQCVLYVRDNGRGISEACRAKVFQPFQRFHPEITGGTGIGLSIVHRLVERLGGHIWFESTVGEGTIFYFTLTRPDNISINTLRSGNLPRPYAS